MPTTVQREKDPEVRIGGTGVERASYRAKGTFWDGRTILRGVGMY